MEVCPICRTSDNSRAVVRSVFKDLLASSKDFHLHVNLCEGCVFGYQVAPLSPGQLSDYYRSENFSAAYPRGKADLSNPLFMRFARNILRLSQVGLNNEDRLLDYGTHRGHFPELLRSLGFENSFGYEPFLSGYSEIDSPRDASSTTLLSKLGDFEAYFDFISALHVLEHVPDLEEFLFTIRRLLKPGGVLLIEVPDLSRFPPDYLNYFFLEHLSYFTDYSLQVLLELNGFQEVEVRKIPESFPDDQSYQVPVLEVTCVRSEGTQRPDRAPAAGSETILASSLQAVNQRFGSRNQKVSEVRHILESFGARPYCIWGGGVHTHYLFGLVPELSPLFIVDSSPEREGSLCCGIDIVSPETFNQRAGEVEAVLISSYSFEKEIRASVEQILASIKREIAIFGLYA